MNRILNFLLTTALFIYIGEYALEKYEFMVLGRQINIEHLTALLEANIQIADSIKHPLPKYFNLSCRAGFMKTNCEIVLYGHDSLIPLRLETDFYRHSEVTDWDPAHLERFPILTFAELLAADLQLSDRSQIQF
ncbi:MAG: hypothetical protein ACXWQE_14800, partial [Bdellovibrionales bacterium]